MRRFNLLKDLPGVPAGTVLVKNDGNNSLHLDNAAETVLPISLVGDIVHLSAMGIFTSDSSEWLEEIKTEPEYKRWRAEPKKAYFYLDDEADVSPSFEDHRPVDDKRHRCGNYFQTVEEAKAHVDYLKALAVVRDDAKGFKPDWKNTMQEKWYVYCASAGDQLWVSRNIGAANGVFGLPYFETEEDAQASIDKHEKEWKIIFGINKKEEE